MEIKYKTTNSGWGLTGFFEGYRLVFSGASERGWKVKNFLPFLKTGQVEDPNSIVKDVDLFNLFSKDAKRAWNQACARAKKYKSGVTSEDIFLALLKEPSVKKLFYRLKVDTRSAETLLKNYLKLSPASSTETVKKIPFQAFELSVKLHSHSVEGVMLLGALLKAAPKDNILQAIFSNIGLSQKNLEVLAVWLLNLDYEFPKNPAALKLLYCCRQAESLEQHFHYFFDFNAIEAAVRLNSKQRYLGTQHALQYLVKAGLEAKKHRSKIIYEGLVWQAAKLIKN